MPAKPITNESAMGLFRGGQHLVQTALSYDGGMSISALAALLLLVTPAFAASYRFGAVWDGDKVHRNVCVNTREDRIESVGVCPAGAVDMSRYMAIPGMIDVHTHMTYVIRNPVSQAGRSAAVVFLAQENARRTLEAGVTTVRDLNAQNYADIAMRDLISSGAMKGPRIFASGGLSRRRGDPAQSVEELSRTVEERVKAGVDWIKMFGSTGSGQDVTGDQTFSFEEMKAAADVAHLHGKRIAIHSYGPAGARDAVRAGTDTLEHATDMDAATIQALAASKIYYVPTIDHNRFYAQNFKVLGFAPESVRDLNDFIARNLETARLAFKAGVRFAMGSDAVRSMFGENTRELGWFVKAGMTPEQALKAATVNGAELLGHEKSLGALRPGYFADIVAVEGDPLADIQVAIDKVRWVMKGGEVLVDKTK
jgi:imidazolonepropionase-like amidohydrolase